MTKTVKAVIRYDGPALAEHEMDVHDLAPALLALGDLCRTANAALNGDQASVKVLVRADIEQKCFQLQFELVQTLYEQLTSLIDRDQVKDAKAILEWLQILGIPTAGVGLFALYRYLSKKKPKDTVQVTTNSDHGSVTYQIIGNENSITVPTEVDIIAQAPGALESVKRILTPLAKTGYESLSFEHNDATTAYISREEAQEILELAPETLQVEREGEHVSKIRTAVRIKRPVYEGDGMWTVIYKKAVDAKILDEDWLSDFQAGRVVAPPRSKLVVDLVETVSVDEDGIAQGQPRYTIEKVHNVVLPPEQLKLWGGNGQ